MMGMLVDLIIWFIRVGFEGFVIWGLMFNGMDNILLIVYI
jgi:hypothetical protein